MHNTRHRIITNPYLPYLVFFSACCFLAVLLSTIKPGVFFSGDAGLKLLVIKQINNSGVYKTLQLQQPEWVEKIWSQGFYPFKQPFIYETPEGKVISFPPAFQWVNAHFYKWFGYRGIYILPAASLVLLWLWFIATLRRFGMNAFIVSCGLFAMAFCSPLTLYAAVYWEHTFAILLVFSGTVYMLWKSPSISGATTLGIVTGLAAWFRPETIVLSGLFGSVSIYNFYRKRNLPDLFFVLSITVVLVAFFVFNQVTYGNIFGAHGYQVLSQTDAINGPESSLTILSHINARFLLFFPAAIVFYVLAAYLFFKKPVLPLVIYQLAIIVILYSLLAPFILPNAGGKQWGPRYFLPLIPVILATLCLVANFITLKRRWAILIIPVIAFSVYLNVYRATKTLSQDYAYRVTPALELLGKLDCDVVIVQNQYISQEFAVAFSNRKFFLAEDDKNFFSLVDKLRLAGISRIIYIASANKGKSLPNQINEEKKELVPAGTYFFAEYYIR